MKIKLFFFSFLKLNFQINKQKDTKKTKTEINNAISGLVQFSKCFSDFLSLCKKLSENVEKDEAVYEKFQESQQNLELLLTTTTKRFSVLQSQQTTKFGEDFGERVGIVKGIVEELLKILQETTHLLSLQNEWKIDRIKEAAVNTLR